MALIDSLVVFVVSLLVGALGIYVGARVVAGHDDYSYAVVTAFIGAVVWTVVGFFLGWIPLFGPLLALVAYVAVINVRYPGDWVSAIAISLIAWVASIVVLYILAVVGLASFEAIGVPGA
jgi:hypothetical protein